jgi:hypothetical protein
MPPWSETKRAAVYGAKLPDHEYLREPVRCPGCGHKITIAPCLECARLAAKNHALLKARAAVLGESSWEN